MSLLDRKLLRDLRALKSQALAVALVMASGLAMMIMTRSLMLSLETTRHAYYEEHRFAQVFAQLKRAPNAVRDELAAIPGVAAVETGIARQVTLDVPGLVEPAVGLINSLPEYGERTLNRPYLRTGRLPLGGETRREIAVSEAFADAHGLRPGDKISAVLNGAKQTFTVSGVVLSPEFVFEAPPGAALPDNKTYGVFWMPYKELATAFQLYGAFDSVALTLAPGASEPRVIAAVDRVLMPYGARGAYGRGDHPSNRRVNDELRVLQGLSIAFPVVFLSVAAFMTNSVMSRQIALQREQIAMLKACGFSNAQVGLHYFKFSLAIVVVGVALGTITGILMGHRLVEMYHLFFRFPQLEFLLDSRVLVAAAGVSSLAAFVGVAGAVRRAVRLPPAEAMRPEAPAHFRPALLERLGAARWFSASFRMALRNIERRPFRSALTCVALALATGILIVPNAFRDGISYVIDFQWDVIQRQTVTLSLVEPGPARALADFAHLPGVVLAEPFRYVPVELRAGPIKRRILIQGLPERGTLSRVINATPEQLTLPPRGIVMSAKLADVLGVKPGDEVVAHVLEGREREIVVPVVGLADDFAGTAAYMEIHALNRLLLEGDQITGAHLIIAAGRWRDFTAAVKETPRIGGCVIKDSLREGFRQTTAQSIGLLQKLYLVFATIVAFGIIYNSARISLSERARELATLRVLGFTRAEVGAVLVGELVILTLIALPLGLVLGSGMARVIIATVNTETVRLPLVLTAANYAFAVLVVALASAASALFAARKLADIDLATALKGVD
ncbi:FtsX family ABC transporter permease [Opitutus sp. ER46]|uniref:ABC transporter permease n=1 Tax=Opitutus sp. ER46 TaxID=2161864 RepID=UPI000D322EE6|nr:FtsX family ABC transporter permease [Opitutus sp. ER46]PTX91369.1 ABC transporter permease [Opitutus sp. ER46]